MALDARFLHWLQAADEDLLYTAGELGVPAEAVDEAPIEAYDAWEARAHMIAAANAVLRAEEESQWPN